MSWLLLRVSSPRAFRAHTPLYLRLTIVAILARSQRSSTLSLYFMSLAAFLTVLIGVSRIYLWSSLSDRRPCWVVHRRRLGLGMLGDHGGFPECRSACAARHVVMRPTANT